jgi:hypothetical protein
MSNSDDFRKLMTLLESIEQGNQSQQLDEIFGIPDLPDWVPGSKANKKMKADEKASEEKYKKESEEVDRVWDNIKARSQSIPVWMYFFWQPSQTMDSLKEVAQTTGILEPFFVDASYDPVKGTGKASNPNADASGIIGSMLAGMLAVGIVPSSYLVYQGKILKSPLTGHRAIVHSPGMFPGMSDFGNLDHPDTASSKNKIIDIVKRWTGRGGPPNGGGERTTEPQKTTVAPPGGQGSNVIPLRPVANRRAA